MKKVLSVFLCLVMVMGIGASAAGLDFMKDSSAKNYSAQQSTSIEVTAPITFAEEMLGAEGTDWYVNMTTILIGLLEQKQDADIQVRCSEDYKKIEVALEAESVSDISVNDNLDVTVRARNGFWMHMDLTDAQAPVFEIIYRYPHMNKYVVLDVFAEAGAEGEDVKAELYEVLDYLFSKEIMGALEDKSIALMEKYATITYNDRICKMHMDSEAFSQYLAVMINEVIDLFALAEAIEPLEADAYKMAVLLSVPQLQLLGEDGYSVEYSLTNKKKLQRMSTSMDVDLYLGDVVNLLDTSGMGWMLEDPGHLACKVLQETKIMHTGDSVCVTYPEITEENSISYMEYMYGGEVIEGEYTEEVLPSYFAEAYCDDMPIINGDIYVPLRTLLESAYGDAVSITYSDADGRIVIESDYFETISTRIGGDSVRVGDHIYIVGEVVMHNDMTYVSYEFFEVLFGWELWSAYYDMIENEYYCFFSTYSY